MSLFSFLRSIYDVDTLDTRFTTPSTVPYKPDTPSSKAGGRSNGTLGHADSRRDAAADIVKRAEPSKWRSPEFFVYYFVFLTVVPYMFWVAYDVSRRMSLPWRPTGPHDDLMAAAADCPHI